MLKYLSKITMDILPSVVATIIGAYIVNHYITTKRGRRTGGGRGWPKRRPAGGCGGCRRREPARGRRTGQGYFRKAAFEKPITAKPVEKPPEKPAEKSAEKTPEPSEDKPAETASIPAEPNAPAAPRDEKTAVRKIPLTASPGGAVRYDDGSATAGRRLRLPSPRKSIATPMPMIWPVRRSSGCVVSNDPSQERLACSRAPPV